MLQGLLLACAARAGQPSMWEANANKPVPIGAKVTLELDRPEYFLGENVLCQRRDERISNLPIGKRINFRE